MGYKYAKLKCEKRVEKSSFLELGKNNSRKTHHQGATQGAKDMMDVNNKNIKQMDQHCTTHTSGAAKL